MNNAILKAILRDVLGEAVAIERWDIVGRIALNLQQIGRRTAENTADNPPPPTHLDASSSPCPEDTHDDLPRPKRGRRTHEAIPVRAVDGGSQATPELYPCKRCDQGFLQDGYHLLCESCRIEAAQVGLDESDFA